MKFLELNIQLFAHKKGQSSGEYVTAGSIIYRQRGTKIFPGVNVKRGNDDTLYATVDGIVKFERKGRDKKQASVYPVSE